MFIQKYSSDSDYVRERNKLIPLAEEHANENAGPCPKGDLLVRRKWECKWSRLFHEKMDELAREAGLTGGGRPPQRRIVN